jgi:hypothetical protein
MNYFYAFVAVVATALVVPALAGCTVSTDDGGGGRPSAPTGCLCDPLPHMTFTCASDGVTCLVTGCDPGWSDCDGNPGNGCESDLSRPEHCGICGFVCDKGEVCHQGGPIPTCSAPLIDGGHDDDGGDGGGNPFVPDAG